MKRLFLLLTLFTFSTIYAQVQNTNNSDQEQLQKWTDTMQFGISDQRLAIVKQIRANKITNALSLLKTSFSSDNNQKVKEEMIYTFIDMNYNDTDFWNTILKEEDNLIVLQRVAYAIEKMKIPIGEEMYIKLSNYSTNPKAIHFNAAAVRALGTLQFTNALPIITELATNTTNNQDLRGSAVVAIGMYQDTNFIPLLQSFLTNILESRLIRRYAALAIGRTKSPSAVEILAPVITNEAEEQTVRLNAIEGLGYIPNDTTIPIIEQLTKSDNTALRTEAIKSLGKMKAISSQKILEYKALNDPEAIVRREAKKALQNLGIDISTLDSTKKSENKFPMSTTTNTTTNITQQK